MAPLATIEAPAVGPKSMEAEALPQVMLRPPGPCVASCGGRSCLAASMLFGVLQKGCRPPSEESGVDIRQV